MLGPTGLVDVLLASLVVELRKDDTLKGLCSITVFGGDSIPMDYGLESCGGMVWARLTSANPTLAFPAADTTVDSCTASLAYGVELGVIRPAPFVDEAAGRITLPTEEDQREAAILQNNDMLAMHRAYKAARDDIDLMVIGQYQPYGPQGDVMGGFWSATVGEDLDG